jgi:predicted metalloprotease with PDZ domain
MTTNIEAAAIVYDVRPADPGAHLYEVTCLIGAPDPDGQEFSMPAWVPGSYMIRDYARHVISVVGECDGEPVALHKIDKSTWRAAEVNRPLLIRAVIYAFDISVRGAYLDYDHGFINGVCLFFRVHGKEEERCIVHLAPPESDRGTNWTVATGLDRVTGNSAGFGAFAAFGYDALIDHPVLMGSLVTTSFELAGAEHEIAIVGADGLDLDLDRLRQDAQLACASHVEMFGGELPLNRYVFLVTAVSNGYGGLEHRNSSALICARSALPLKGRSQATAAYRRFLGLVSHEYFHLWNVKRIRPAEFVPYQLDRENYTRQLWIFEGITSYYDDLGLLRGGLIGVDDYLELLGRSLTTVYRAAGRRQQTLEESSFDAWTKFYKQDENSPNAIVSYYRKGAMVALALDLELRLKTNGNCTLDDVMRALWTRYGGEGTRGLPEDGFELLAEEVSGLHLGDFFQQCLRTTIDPPVGILLAQFGVRLNMRAMESETDVGGKAGKRVDRPRPWLGFRTRGQGDRSVIRHVLHDGAAAKAGLSANDEIVALNGNRVTATNWNELVDALPVNEPAAVSVFRRDQLRRFELTAMPPPRDTCYLTVESDADVKVAGRRQGWLGD